MISNNYEYRTGKYRFRFPKDDDGRRGIELSGQCLGLCPTDDLPTANQIARIIARAVNKNDEKAGLVLMVDVFCSCIESGILPSQNSPCHKMARELVDKSGMKPKRKRTK